MFQSMWRDDYLLHCNMQYIIVMGIKFLSGLAILPGPGFPTPGKPGLGNNAFLAKVGNNGQ